MTTYGFLCSDIERKNLSVKEYHPSKQKLDFDRECGYITIFLSLTNKIDGISFTEDEIESYKSFLTLSIDIKSLNIQEIKYNINNILREQSIVATVANWQDYFSEILDYIFTDVVLIKKIYNDKKKLKNFLDSFNLKIDFINEMLLNGPQLDDLRFAKHIRQNRKIDFQNRDHLKKFFRIVYEIEIVKIDEKNWTEIVEFIEDRHIIAHSKEQVIEKYPKDKIEKIIANMKKIIGELDNILFTVYQ